MWTVSTNRCRSLPHPPSFIVPTCRFSLRSSSLVLRKWKILLCQDSTCLVLLSRHFVPTSCSPGYVVSQGLDYKIINETMSVSEHGHVLRRTSLRLRSIVLRSSIRLSILLYPHFLFSSSSVEVAEENTTKTHRCCSCKRRRRVDYLTRASLCP